MPCRRVSFSGSFPRTGRSSSSSIRSGWRSGSRSRSPAESDSRHNRARPVPLGERVPRSVSAFAPLCGLLLVLAASASVSLGAVPSPGTGPAAVSGTTPAPAPPGPAPAPSPTAPPPEQGSPPPQEGERGSEAGQEAPPPAGHERTEEPAGPEGPVAGEKGVIGRIVVDGNVRVSDTAFFSNLHLKSGDPYDERAIQDEFRRLWDLELFDDIIVETRKRSGNVFDLIFHVRDRPLVGNVAFVGMKAVTEANIQERLNQAKCEVRRGQPVDFSLLRRAEAAIEQLLGEKGYLQARARARLTPVGQGQREVTFNIHEGSKTKIKDIDFVGNTVYTDRRLRKLLKLTKKPFWLTSWASSKTLYHPAKFAQDAENSRTAYKGVGYIDVAIQPEIVELVGGKKEKARHGGKGTTVVVRGPPQDLGSLEEQEDFEEPAPVVAPPGETEKQRKKRVKAELKAKKERDRQPKKWVRLTVPIVEGPQYKVGKIEIEGNSVFSAPEAMARVPLRPGLAC